MEESEKRIMERQELDRRIEVGDMEFINRFFSTDISVEELVESYNSGRKDFSDIGLCNIEDHQAFYCNTVMSDGSVEIGPHWAEG
jgi:hypothetical protein